ncbi:MULTISPECIES: lipocalin-like domain-containing protein [Bacillus]|uniref:lipocalin-like domain-containing protein n=1 Tax=Bacillus TaxID=1386 RepID=UPI00235931FB|nr:lipocalin-like domain-containing protein [Bacillus cereus]MDA2644478.1 lipocalin-like domain-containing protein [Bacillus cereus]WCT67331.1 lipocalin-like domain-containing protein [Bacillus cereus]HDR4457502.1 lipocalin-like domain-containing protein [Bacillus cereus]
MGQKEQFIGTWRLTDFFIKKINGAHLYPFGKKPNGMLIYNKYGYMSVIISGEKQPNEVNLDFKNTSAIEQALAIQHISYCGLFEVQEKQIIHSVFTSIFPQWKDTQLKRYYHFEKNKLTLTTEPLNITKMDESFVLIWEREN